MLINYTCILMLIYLILNWIVRFSGTDRVFQFTSRFVLCPSRLLSERWPAPFWKYLQFFVFRESENCTPTAMGETLEISTLPEAIDMQKAFEFTLCVTIRTLHLNYKPGPPITLPILNHHGREAAP